MAAAWLAMNVGRAAAQLVMGGYLSRPAAWLAGVITGSYP